MSGQQQPGKIVERLDWQALPSARGLGQTTGAGVIEWGAWLRAAERKRRLLIRNETDRPRPLPPAYFARATFSSFRLDGIDISEREVLESLAAGAHRTSLRSRSAQRIRNHASILYHVECSIRLGEALQAPVVMRWYASIGSGLVTAALSDAVMNRLDQVVRRINSPQLRMQAALADIARLHCQLLSDPVVPSFNGILARLLLRYHLGRVGLPPVVFDPNADAPNLLDDTMLLARLLELIDQSYDLLLRATEPNA